MTGTIGSGTINMGTKTTGSEANSELSALLCLKLRNAIADKEWWIAAANHDVAKYGGWQCDYYQDMKITDGKIQELIAEIEV